jgi:hypothetical protein
VYVWGPAGKKIGRRHRRRRRLKDAILICILNGIDSKLNSELFQNTLELIIPQMSSPPGQRRPCASRNKGDFRGAVVLCEDMYKGTRWKDSSRKISTETGCSLGTHHTGIIEYGKVDEIITGFDRHGL